MNELASLRAALDEAQRERQERVAFTLGRPLGPSLSGPWLRDLLDSLLPMAQERAVQLRRNRDGSWRVSIRLRYRMGVRIADACQRGDLSPLSLEERQTFDKAQSVIAAARQDAPDPLTLARRLFDAVCACAVYENPPVGSPAHPHVVSAASALVGGRANCQGFSDAYYLLGTLAGLKVRYQSGTKGRAPHLWNLLLLDGRWRTVDVASGAFLPDDAELAALGLCPERL